jgi:hypothetical protein
MRRPLLAAATLLASAALGGCFSDDTGNQTDAGFSLPDTAVQDIFVPQETGADTTVADSAQDAPPETSADAPAEAVVDVGVDAPPDVTVDSAVADTATDSPVADVVAEARGCTKATDCPPLFACDTSTGQCVDTCGGAAETACNGGCCATGRCAAGTANGACGNNGAACVGCANGTPPAAPRAPARRRAVWPATARAAGAPAASTTRAWRRGPRRAGRPASRARAIRWVRRA